MPTCIEARVRKLGLKNTSATDFPASDFSITSPLLNFCADSIISSSSFREKSDVLRKFFIINLVNIILVLQLIYQFPLFSHIKVEAGAKHSRRSKFR